MNNYQTYSPTRSQMVLCSISNILQDVVFKFYKTIMEAIEKFQLEPLIDQWCSTEIKNSLDTTVYTCIRSSVKRDSPFSPTLPTSYSICRSINVIFSLFVLNVNRVYKCYQTVCNVIIGWWLISNDDGDDAF